MYHLISISRASVKDTWIGHVEHVVFWLFLDEIAIKRLPLRLLFENKNACVGVGWKKRLPI